MWLVDYKKLTVWLTPTYLRRSNLTLLVAACSWPLRQDYDGMQRFITDKQYRLAHNSQVCYLRAVLNDAFDNRSRRIRIVDFDGLTKYYLWPDEDQRDIDITNSIYLWQDDAYGDSGVDFTVEIPARIVTSDSELALFKSLMNEYKTPGKAYNIKRI